MHIATVILAVVVVALPEISAHYKRSKIFDMSDFDNAFDDLAPRVRVYDYPAYRPYWARNRLYSGSRRSNSGASATGDGQVDFGTVDADETVLTTRDTGFAHGQSRGRGYGARISSSAASKTEKNNDFNTLSWF